MSRPQVPRHQHPEGGDTITAMLLIWPSRVVKSKELLALTFLNESNKNIVMNNICNCPNGRSIMDVCIACWRAKRLPYQCTQHLYLLKLIQVLTIYTSERLKFKYRNKSLGFISHINRQILKYFKHFYSNFCFLHLLYV